MTKYYKTTNHNGDLMFGNSDSLTVAVVTDDGVKTYNYGEREWGLWIAQTRPEVINTVPDNVF